MSAGDKEIVRRILVNYGRAIEAYLKKLVSRNAPSIATSPAIRMRSASRPSWGRKLFIGKARFIGCHNTPLFSDDDFHIIGLHIDTSLSPHADPTETGRSANQSLICNPAVADRYFNVNGHFSDDPHTTRDGNFCQQPIPVGLWRTKTLRQIAETRPLLPRRSCGDTR